MRSTQWLFPRVRLGGVRRRFFFGAQTALRQSAGLISLLALLGGPGSLPAPAQTLRYAVGRRGKTVGHIEAERKLVEGDERYTFLSWVSVSVLFHRVDVRDSARSVYRAGSLRESLAQNQVNGQVKARAQVRQTATGYALEKDGHAAALPAKSIGYSLGALYFREPAHEREVFSERHAALLPLARVGPHHYAVRLPDGNYNHYWFADGVCAKVEVSLRFGTLTFTRQVGPGTAASFSRP